MSLVELALAKMQSARAGAAGAANKSAAPSARAQAPGSGSTLAAGVVGEVVQRSSHRRIDPSESARLPNHDKLIRIDPGALCAAGLAPPEDQARMLANEYRHIKRPLIGAAIGRGADKLERGQLIMMASAMAGEGKTFTSINLALSMALEHDISVLLVDADIPKPHITRTFGVEHEPGLIDVLRDPEANVESVILPTDLPNLSLLPAGRRSETATELLASHRMEQTVNYLAASDPTRIVLIDSPPLLLTSESRALAHWVGQVVLVIRSDFTPQQAVMDAIAQVGPGKAVSLVLNQSRGSSPGYYYGYGDIPASTDA